ncbi:MAG: PEP-CTERM sorting domain-containing protein [Armatimonadota bacterium]
MKLLRVFLVVLLMAFAATSYAQTWGVYSTLDGHVQITRTAEGPYWRWTYLFWHGNEAVPQDPVYFTTVRFATTDDGNVLSIKNPGERYWDYTGRWETGSGAGTNPFDYVWNGDWQPIPIITETNIGGNAIGRWDITAANEGEYRRFEVSFLTDLPYWQKGYLNVGGADGAIAHSILGEVPYVPEPSSVVALLAGVSGLAGYIRLRRK